MINSEGCISHHFYVTSILLISFSATGGGGASCTLAGASLRVLFGAGASLAPTHTMTLRTYPPEDAASLAANGEWQSYLRACPDSPTGARGTLETVAPTSGSVSGNTGGGFASVWVPWPLNILRARPTLRLEAPAVVALCQTVAVSVARVTHTGQRPPVYLWSFSAPELLPNGYSLAALRSTHTLLIPTARLVPGQQYSIGVAVRNFLNVTSPEVVHSFAVQPVPLAVVALDGAAARASPQVRAYGLGMGGRVNHPSHTKWTYFSHYSFLKNNPNYFRVEYQRYF
jgi:hypothetical protein